LREVSIHSFCLILLKAWHHPRVAEFVRIRMLARNSGESHYGELLLSVFLWRFVFFGGVSGHSLERLHLRGFPFVSLRFHPAVQLATQRDQRFGELRIARKVDAIPRIGLAVVKLSRRAALVVMDESLCMGITRVGLLLPCRKYRVFGRSILKRCLGREVADVAAACAAHRANAIVLRATIDASRRLQSKEIRFVRRRGTSQHRNEVATIKNIQTLDVRRFEKRRHHVHILDQCVAYRASRSMGFVSLNVLP